MNTYIISLYIKGKSEKKYSITLIIKDTNKNKAIEKAKKEIEDEGFVYGGYDFCDLAD